jgi:hypothetical protein
MTIDSYNKIEKWNGEVVRQNGPSMALFVFHTLHCLRSQDIEFSNSYPRPKPIYHVLESQDIKYSSFYPSQNIDGSPTFSPFWNSV